MYKEYQSYKKEFSVSHRLFPTHPDIEGPFYKPGAPRLEDCSLSKTPTLHLSGSVKNTSGECLNATLDFWQADEKGVYDNEHYNLRGVVVSDGKGYQLHTIVPGDYQIGENEYRCSHIHVKVSSHGYKPLTTQLYFPDDKYNKTDHWFDVKRVIQIPDGHFDFVLEKA